MKKTAEDESAEEAKLVAIIRESFVERMPFNRILGIDVLALHHEQAECRFTMRPELVGNYVRNILHGGVTSAVLDVTGGLVAFLGVQRKMRGQSVEEILERFSRIGTIDLRVDYLRPGQGAWFIARGYPLRTGNKVTVARMEMVNDRDELIAVGTAAYTVS